MRFTQWLDPEHDRSLRGGSFVSRQAYARRGGHGWLCPSFMDSGIGFRIFRSV